MEFEHSFTIPVPPDKAWDVLLDVERVAPCMPGATVDTVDGADITGHVKVKVGPITMTYAGHARFVDRDPVAHTVILEASGKESRGTGTASAMVHAALYGENGQADGQADGQTKVTMSTTLNVTGRPAQMGRGVLADVSGKLVERFAANLAEQLTADAAHAAAAADAAAGHPAAGDTAVGDTAVGDTAVGDTAVGDTAVGDTAVGDTAVGDTAVGAGAGTGAAAPRGTSTSAAASAATPSSTAPTRKKEDETLDLLGVAAGPVMRRIVPAIGVLSAVIFVGLLAWLRRKRKNTS